MSSKAFTVPAGKVDALRSRVAELNKRAERLGLPPVTYTIGEVRYVELEEWCPYTNRTRSTLRALVDVAFQGEAPRVDGWAFVARLEHTAAGNPMARAPMFESDESVDLSGWATAGADCSHCRLDRKRKDTFLLQNEAGELRQVGSTCLEDFTRSTDAVAAAGLWLLWAELTRDLEDEDSEDFGFGAGGDGWATARGLR